MAKRDYYDILGVARNADEKELKSAFRKLAKQCHPDASPSDSGAERKFKEINEAYDVLKDPQKRAAYDRFGHAAFEAGVGAGARAQGFGPEFTSSMSDIFEDLFGDFMSGGRGRGRGGRNGQARGSDLRYNMEITLTVAFSGKTAQIRVPTAVGCESCKGSGGKAGTSP
jgi:molecular chaperone DnaJ